MMAEDNNIGGIDTMALQPATTTTNTGLVIHQNNNNNNKCCRVCLDTIQDDDSNIVQIYPCNCIYCAECFIIYVAQTRLIENFICTTCNIPINSHRTKTKEYFYSTKSWSTFTSTSSSTVAVTNNNSSNGSSKSKQIVQETTVENVDDEDVNNSDTIQSEPKSSSQKVVAAASPPVLAPVAVLGTACGKSTDAIPSLPPPPKASSVQATSAVIAAEAAVRNNGTTVAKPPPIIENNDANKRKQSPTKESTSNKKKKKATTKKDNSHKNTSAVDNNPNKYNKMEYKSTDEYIEEMRAYRIANGNCLVSFSENEKLARFAYRVRAGLRKVTDGQRKLLDELGFQWVREKNNNDIPESEQKKYKFRKKFADRLKDLEEYKNQHGDCLVPYKYLPDRSLGEWVKDVRRGHVKVNKEQRKELNRIGFNWETKTNRFEREWNEKLDKIKAYQKMHGHTKIPYQWEYDKSLYEWCNTQRKLNNKNKLRADRKHALDAIGFCWGNSNSKTNNKKDNDSNNDGDDNNNNDTDRNDNDNNNEEYNNDKNSNSRNNDNNKHFVNVVAFPNNDNAAAPYYFDGTTEQFAS